MKKNDGIVYLKVVFLIFSLMICSFTLCALEEDDSTQNEKNIILTEDVWHIFNGRFIGEGMEICVYPRQKERFSGELSKDGATWVFEGIYAEDYLSCVARKVDGGDESIPLLLERRTEKVQDGTMTARWCDKLYQLKEVPLREISGYYQGKNIIFHIEKYADEYEGEIEIKGNTYESKIYPLTGKEQGGRIVGKYYDPRAGDQGSDFDLEERDGKFYFKIENHTLELQLTEETVLLRKALTAKNEKRWKDVQISAEAVKRLNRYHLRKAVDLAREAEQALLNEHTVKKHIKWAEEFCKNEDWERVQKETVLALELDPENEKALELNQKALEELHSIELLQVTIRSDMEEIVLSKANGDWERVKKSAERVLTLDPENKEALSFKAEAEDKLQSSSGEERILSEKKDSESYKAEEVKFLKENFHHLQGEYQGDGMILKIRSDTPGQYSGTIFLKENSEAGMYCFIAAEEKDGRIEGECCAVNGEWKRPFTLEFGENTGFIFTEEENKRTLRAGGSTGYLITALEAKERQDWETVRLEARKILTAGNYHLREAIDLWNQADKRPVTESGTENDQNNQT